MAMNRISITFKISISLAFLVVSILLAAQTLGILPDLNEERRRSQLALCESIALNTSLAIQHDQQTLMRESLRAMVDRDRSIAYARVLHHHETLAEFTSDNQPIPASERGRLVVVKVPIVANNEPWGTVELGLGATAADSSWYAFLFKPFNRLLLFCGCLAIPAFFVYLRRLLQHLDPSNVVPARVRTTLDTLAEGLVVVDDEQRIVLANNVLASMLDSDSEELLGKNIASFPWLFEDEELFEEELPWTIAMKQARIVAGQVVQLTNDAGQKRTLRVNASPIEGRRDECEGALVSFDDVTLLEERNTALTSMLDKLRESRDQIQRQNRELTILATRDSLTGALNRRCFFEEFERRWKHAKRTSSQLCGIMIDVDHFKSINDNYGHASGDTVLKEVVTVVEATIRQNDILCRYGGEEFCVLCPDGNLAIIRQLAESIRESISKIQIEGIGAVTASLGISATVFGAESPNDLLNQADAALYHSKRTGRNRTTCWGDIKDNTDFAEGIEHESHAQIPFEAVNALLNALGNRDPSTVEHSRRVSDMCLAMSQTLLERAELKLLRNAALLHEIGRLCVPDSILHKNDELDEGEMEVIQKHYQTGIDIVRSTFRCDELADLIMQFRSKRNDVSIASRVLAIVDAYDTMTSDRSYRERMSKQDAIAELTRLAGKEYDPVLVRRFVAFLNGELDTKQHEKAKDTRSQIEEQLESLAAALDERNSTVAQQLVDEIRQAARQIRNPTIDELVEALCESAQQGDQWPESVRLTAQLMDLCRIIQNDDMVPGEAVTDPAAPLTPTLSIAELA